MKPRIRSLAVIAAAATLFAGCSVPVEVDDPAAPSADQAETQTEAAAEEAADAEKPKEKSEAKEKEPEKEPEVSVAKQNAIRAAEDYLDYSAFSKSGLIEQLEFEGYSKKDAKYAVNHIEVNWNKQAERAAADYLDYTSFSRSGLIEQLEFEGYTREQAQHGVDSTGL